MRSKSSNNAINYISAIALVGVLLATAALYIVLSGFAGLRDYTLQFSTLINPDLKVETSVGKSMTITDEQFKRLEAIAGVQTLSKIIEERVIIRFDDKTYPAAKIKGVDANYAKINSIDSILVEGDWVTQNSNEIVVGWGISRNLGFNVLDFGKRVSLYVPKPGKGQITSVNKAFNTFYANNVGIFEINETYNDTYVYAPIALARSLLNYNEQTYTALEVKLDPNADEDVVKTAIQKVLGPDITVKNRIAQNDAMYRMLNTEYLAVYLIFTLVLIIALFNIIGSIIMMILDKRKNMQTLYNLGTSITDIRRIFFFQGSLMALVGGVLGLTLGFIIIWLQSTFALVMITPTLPYPVKLQPINLLIVFVTIVVLGVMASKIASTRITKSLVKIN